MRGCNNTPADQTNSSCILCDRKLSAETACCDFCGERVTATWSRDIRLVTDRFILKDMVMVFVIAVVVAELLVAGTSFLLGRGVLWMPPHIMGLILVFVLALSIFAAGVVLGNRITMAFLVTPVGIAWGTGSRQKKVDRTAAAVSMVAGSPTAAGASLLAVAQESGLLPWEEIRKLTAFPGPGVITLSNSWRPVLRLYVPATVWYYFNLDDLWRPLFLAGLLVAVGTLIGGAARRVLGFVGMAITLYLFVRHMMEGFDPIIGPSGFNYGRSYSADPILFALSVVGYLALLALGVRCVVGRISRG